MVKLSNHSSIILSRDMIFVDFSRNHESPRLHVYWKHTLETLSFGNIICIWKQKMYIGNIHWILETKIGYWKHEKAFGNIICILETSLWFGNICILETYNEKLLTCGVSTKELCATPQTIFFYRNSHFSWLYFLLWIMRIQKMYDMWGLK